jgi:hypothetical protein
MPFFPTVDGDYAQLCVFVARDQDCTRKDCTYPHELKLRRPCRFFHSKTDYCRDGDACLPGHQEARDAWNQHKQAKARKAECQPQEATNQAYNNSIQPATITGHGTGAAPAGFGPDAGAGAGAGAGARTGAADNTNQPLFNNPHVALLTLNHANPKPNPDPNQSVNLPVPATNQDVPPVHFQQLALANDTAGQNDEITRPNIRQEEMRKEFDNFKRQNAEKENEIRLLQTSMGEMQSKNEKLKNENESKPASNRTDLLNQYYINVHGQASITRSLLNLDRVPLSEKALEAALVMMATLYARPTEFSGNTKIIDLFNNRPDSRFSADVPSLKSLGIDISVPEHGFFVECYMKFLADPSFCKNGKLETNSAVVSMPPGGAFPLRASIVGSLDIEVFSEI